jgi:2-hydroxy-6-oxo-6-(2'-carboxyphenyl)-hexa-2,4-dienoate hydrolase
MPSTSEERDISVFSYDYFDTCPFFLTKREVEKMMWMKRFTCLALMLPIIILSSNLFAAECTINAHFMDRGETKVFIICGKNITRNYALKGLSDANITIEYEQYLEMCDIGKEDPGIYLILRAEDDATTASVSIFNADTKEPVCEGLSIVVSDRIHIQEATLEDLPDPNLSFKILTIKGVKSHDLSQACVEGLSFPKGKWPSLSLLTKGEIEAIPPASRSGYTFGKPLVCKKSSVQALVNVQGQQRYPAKIVISKVRLKGGEEKEGVAYVMLPLPAWVSAMRDEDAKYVNVNGFRTRYFEKGKGDAVLLVHGGQAGDTSSGAQKWKQNFNDLSKYFHVYAVDRLGQGYTDNPKTDEDYEEYYTKVVDHIYGFIQAVGIKKVHLVGQSQGGWPITRLALDHPEIVKSVVCMDCGMVPPSPSSWTLPFFMYIMFYVDPPEGATQESILRRMELWSYSMNNITDESVQKAFTISRLPKRIEARKQMIKHNMSPAHPSFQALRKKALDEIKEGKLKVPTLILWGNNDPAMYCEGGIELFKWVSSGNPESQLHIFNNCGHSPYIEYPEQFNRLIKSFCGAYASPPIE